MQSKHKTMYRVFSGMGDSQQLPLHFIFHLTEQKTIREAQKYLGENTLTRRRDCSSRES